VQDRKAKLFVFAAPSGAGKTTLVHAVVTKRPELRFSISYTTRKPRRNEADGVDYLFVTEDEFMRLRDQGEMLEYAKVFDNYYATSRSQVEKHLADNRNVILEIDWQGAQQVRQSMPECVTIFILPPSSDMSHWTEFDHVIINDDLNRAIADLEDVLDGEGEASATSNIALRRAVERIIG
jgi:guanylate kinase